MSKLNVVFKKDAEYTHDLLGLTEERAEELNFRFNLILHEFLRPTREGFLPPIGNILKLFVALAENEQELVYCAYYAGMKVEELFGDALTEEDQE
jgi:hypothetical protein